MKIVLAKHAGLCSGVERALSLALNAPHEPVYLLGNIAHNERIIRDLSSAGRVVISPNDLDTITEGTGV